MNKTVEAKEDHMASNGSAFVLTAAAIAGVTLCILVAMSPSHLIYDERIHIQGARLLLKGVGIIEMVRTPLPSPTGPLYPILHALFGPLTGLTAPGIRFVNLGMLALAFLALVYVFARSSENQPFARASMMLALPSVWVGGGMALTEIPALAMATVSCAFVAHSIFKKEQNDSLYSDLAAFFFAGIFAGFAVLARQTYLLMFVMFVLCFAIEKRLRLPAIIGLLVAVSLVFPVFWLWGGLVPRTYTQLGSGISISPIHGWMGLSYLAIYVALVAPGFYRSTWRWAPLLGVATLAANFMFVEFKVQPFRSVFVYLGPAEAHYLSVTSGAIIIAAGVVFLYSLLHNMWERRSEPIFLGVVLLTLVLIATTFGIGHFSSRYVLVAFPFAIIMVQPYFVPSKWGALRLLAGSGLGIFSLTSYFWP